MHRTTPDAIERPDWLTTETWPFEVRTYSRDTAEGRQRIHYLDEGTGQAIVFVHAGMWSFVWRDVIADLRSDFRCITLDFPGAGLTDGDPGTVDLATFPAVVNDLLDHLEIERATMVVHDLGGVVGVTAAAQRPERIEALVAANAFAWPPDVRPLRVMLGVMGSAAATATLGTFGVVPRLSGSKYGVGRHFERADKSAFLGPYRSRRRSRNFHRAMASARKSPALFADAEAALATTLGQRPVLTVFGEKNDRFGFADRWHGLFPHADAWSVPDGNHFPMCDEPVGFAERVRIWHRDEVASPNGNATSISTSG